MTPPPVNTSSTTTTTNGVPPGSPVPTSAATSMVPFNAPSKARRASVGTRTPANPVSGVRSQGNNHNNSHKANSGTGSKAAVDFNLITLNSLRKYRRRFQMRLSPTSNKAELVDAVSAHFSSIPAPTDEQEVIRSFVSIIRQSTQGGKSCCKFIFVFRCPEHYQQ